MLDICKKLVQEALCQGADAADCIASATEGISADIYDGQVDSFQKSQTQGIGLRVLRQGRVGYAYTERLEGAERIVAQAKEEAGRILARAQEEARLEKQKMSDEIKQEIVSVASVMAGKLVGASIDTARQNSLIEETLKEMGEDTWQN